MDWVIDTIVLFMLENVVGFLALAIVFWVFCWYCGFAYLLWSGRLE